MIEQIKTPDILVLQESSVHPEPTLIEIALTTQNVITVFWETTWNVMHEGRSVPVLDFLDRAIIEGNPNSTCMYDTESIVKYRIDEQRELHKRMVQEVRYGITQRLFPPWILDNSRQIVGRVYQPPPPAQPPPPIEIIKYIQVENYSKMIPKYVRTRGTKPIPTFVAEALAIQALVKNESCPISMNTFRESDHFTITNCYHCFDDESITSWYNTKKTCPTCKSAIHSFVVFKR